MTLWYKQCFFLVFSWFVLISYTPTSQAARVPHCDFEDNGSGTTQNNLGPYTVTLNDDTVTGPGKSFSGLNIDDAGGTGHVDVTHQPSFFFFQNYNVLAQRGNLLERNQRAGCWTCCPIRMNLL